MPLVGAKQKSQIAAVMCADGPECDHFSGNLQSLLAAFRRPRTGQKTYPHSNGELHGQLRLHCLPEIELCSMTAVSTLQLAKSAGGSQLA